MKPNIRVFVLIVFSLLAVACKTQSKAGRAPLAEKTTPFVPVSDISLYDKPLDTIKRHITSQRWQLWYSVGGITGRDKNTFTESYYTLTKDGKLISEMDGRRTEQPYYWEAVRDIFTGDSTYVITGVVNWKVEGIYKDTLRLADNYVDGYGYALTRVE